MERLIILLERPADFVAPLLMRAALNAVRARSDMTLAGICVRRPKSYPRLVWRHLRDQWRLSFRRRWERRGDLVYRQPWPLNLPQLVRSAGGRVLIPPHHNLNHPDFVTELRTVVRPTLALTLLCGQRYGRELLETLGYAVNYHNGQLPDFRGVHATSWAIYRGVAETGFTFHRMDEQLDCGPILLTGALPIPAAADLWSLEYAKAQAAAAVMPRLLELMVARAAGTPQSGTGNYYSQKDNAVIRTITDPGKLTCAELVRRLQAFGSLWLLHGKRWYSVSRLSVVGPSQKDEKWPCLRTVDDVWLRAEACRALKQLPPMATP